jgi:predicted nucleic acid-binding protein
METSSEAVIIADTSGLVSLFSPNDRNHALAVTAAKQLQNQKRDILIPAAVLVEFLNVMGRKADHAVALAAVTELLIRNKNTSISSALSRCPLA